MERDRDRDFSALALWVSVRSAGGERCFDADLGRLGADGCLAGEGRRLRERRGAGEGGRCAGEARERERRFSEAARVLDPERAVAAPLRLAACWAA